MADTNDAVVKKALPRCGTCGKAVRGRYDIDAPLCGKCSHAAFMARYEAEKKETEALFAAHAVGEKFQRTTRWGSVLECVRAEIAAFGSAPRIVNLERDIDRNYWRGGYVAVRFYRSATGILHGHGGEWVERHGKFVPCNVTKLNRNTSTVVGWYDELKAAGRQMAL